MKTLLHKLKLKPEQVIVAGFLLLILFGAVLLCLPFATRERGLSFLNALFTSTSAVCVTGLVVVDTAMTFTPFGQLVILALIQIGGLGVMTVMSTVFIILGKRITLSERLLIQNQLNEDNISGMVRLIIRVIKVTLVAEGAGALIFATRFVPAFGVKGIYYSVFHAISSFCNAGFDVFSGITGHEFSSLVGFANDPVIMITTMLLIITGGLGFMVVADIFSPIRMRQHKRLTRYSRFVLMLTGSLIVIGAALFFVFELPNPATLGSDDLTVTGKIMGGFFQSVTPRTAGFNTIDEGVMTPAGKLVTMVLMFIGASPSGTGGGIKTTTFAVVLLFALATIIGRKEPKVFDRRLATDTIRRAVTIMILSLLLVGFAFLVVVSIEGQRGMPFTFENILFEVLSAFGTVGLTAGLTPLLSVASRIVIIFVMFAGRVGFMTLVMALSSRGHNNECNIRYPEARFMVG